MGCCVAAGDGLAAGCPPCNTCPLSSTLPPTLWPPNRRLRTGTSQSVPFVAGVMALILQNATGTSPADMQRLLVSSAAAGQLSEVPGSGFATVEKVGGGGGRGRGLQRQGGHEAR